MTTAGLVFSQVLLQLVMFQAPNEDVLMPDIVMPSDSIRSDDGGPNDETNTESFLESIKVEDLLMTARNALTADQFPEAMAAYTVATDRLPQDQRIQYNLGIAAYRAGDLETAARAFERSADSPNPELTAAALFNRGNVSYRQALDSVQAAQSEQQIQSAEQGAPDPTTLDDPIQALETAISHYRDAITTEPGNRDARRNAELAWRLKKALQEQQEQQEQEQDQEQQDQEQQDQEQQDQEQQDQEQQDQEQQDQEQQDQEQQDQEQQDQEQESAKPGEGKSKNARMSEQQAEALLQMIRDKEKGRRAELEEREARAAARRYRPVEKDW